MMHKKCIVCEKEGYYPFCSMKCRKIAMSDPDTYIEKIQNKLDKKEELLEKIDEYKKDLSKIKNETGEYVLRKLNTKNKTGDAYGITLPKSVWGKYYRYICKLKSNGIIVLIPKELK